MTTTPFRSLWDEPRASGAPTRVWRDWVLVGGALVTAVLEGIFREDVTWRPFVTLVAIALLSVLLWRRTHPLACVLVAFGTGLTLSVASLVADVPSVGLHTMAFILVLVYALVRWGSGREIGIGLAVLLVLAVVGTAAAYTGLGDAVGGFAVLVAAAAAGAAFRYRAENRRRSIDQIRNQERVGLARELHDTVAHHVSAIAVQAQAGRALATQRPEAAQEALTAIEAEASLTLAEMRAMVRVLRDGEPAEYAPQPGVADLVSLARDEAAPAVEVELAGDLAGLPVQVDAAIYRLARESLTNALRHARDPSRVLIRVDGGTGRVRLRVTDDGKVDPSRPPVPGFGLLGMTERLQLLGGTLWAGPSPGGGWTVDAELPTDVRR